MNNNTDFQVNTNRYYIKLCMKFLWEYFDPQQLQEADDTHLSESAYYTS